jgi:hypothetical protein
LAARLACWGEQVPNGGLVDAEASARGGDSDPGVVLDESAFGDLGEEARALFAQRGLCGQAGGGLREAFPRHFPEGESPGVSIGKQGVRLRVVRDEDEGGFKEGACPLGVGAG